MKKMTRRTKRLIAVLIVEVVIAVNVFATFAAENEPYSDEVVVEVTETVVGGEPQATSETADVSVDIDEANYEADVDIDFDNDDVVDEHYDVELSVVPTATPIIEDSSSEEPEEDPDDEDQPEYETVELVGTATSAPEGNGVEAAAKATEDTTLVTKETKVTVSESDTKMSDTTGYENISKDEKTEEGKDRTLVEEKTVKVEYVQTTTTINVKYSDIVPVKDEEIPSNIKAEIDNPTGTNADVIKNLKASDEPYVYVLVDEKTGDKFTVTVTKEETVVYEGDFIQETEKRDEIVKKLEELIENKTIDIEKSKDKEGYIYYIDPVEKKTYKYKQGVTESLETTTEYVVDKALLKTLKDLIDNKDSEDSCVKDNGDGTYTVEYENIKYTYKVGEKGQATVTKLDDITTRLIALTEGYNVITLNDLTVNQHINGAVVVCGTIYGAQYIDNNRANGSSPAEDGTVSKIKNVDENCTTAIRVVQNSVYNGDGGQISVKNYVSNDSEAGDVVNGTYLEDMSNETAVKVTKDINKLYEDILNKFGDYKTFELDGVTYIKISSQEDYLKYESEGTNDTNYAFNNIVTKNRYTDKTSQKLEMDVNRVFVVEESVEQLNVGGIAGVIFAPRTKVISDKSGETYGTIIAKDADIKAQSHTGHLKATPSEIEHEDEATYSYFKKIPGVDAIVYVKDGTTEETLKNEVSVSRKSIETIVEEKKFIEEWNKKLYADKVEEPEIPEGTPTPSSSTTPGGDVTPTPGTPDETPTPGTPDETPTPGTPGNPPGDNPPAEQPPVVYNPPVVEVPAVAPQVLGARRTQGNGTVLGARRGVDKAVLGKRRAPSTGDSLAIFAWIAALAASLGGAAACAVALKRSK